MANNVRFLILPWVLLPHLASQDLAPNLRRLNRDWQTLYAHPPYLAEPFMDSSRFAGTCHQASNWIYVGQTQGTSKRGNRYFDHSKCIETSRGRLAMMRNES